MNKLKIVVVGTLASDPYAGMAWMHMQIVVGLQRLGHDVYYFETTSTWPYDPILQTRVDNSSYSVPYLKNIMDQFGASKKWAYRCSFSDHKAWIGMSKTKAVDILAQADLVFNISASTRLKEEGLKTKRLVYFGTDPVYHEVKYSQGDKEVISIIEEHDDVITYGENIGNSDCPIPALPRLRAKTRQPILMDLWKNNIKPKDKFTTVGNWKQGGRELLLNGITYYWSKHHEFLKFIDLPLRVDQPIEMATNLNIDASFNYGEGTVTPTLGAEEVEYKLIKANGWMLADGPSLSTNPMKYRDYILDSKAEFTFAKDQNIRLRSGWFSERSACYLAARRPVITQDTGFGNIIPTGEGLFSFNTMEEILIAFDAINSNYKKHSKAALDIAETYFKAETVLEKLLNDLGA